MCHARCVLVAQQGSDADVSRTDVHAVLLQMVCRPQHGQGEIGVVQHHVALQVYGLEWAEDAAIAGAPSPEIIKDAFGEEVEEGQVELAGIYSQVQAVGRFLAAQCKAAADGGMVAVDRVVNVGVKREKMRVLPQSALACRVPSGAPLNANPSTVRPA